MAFTVNGKILDMECTLTWEGPGKLVGSELAVFLATENADSKLALNGPGGMYFGTDYLEHPVAALALIKSIFTVLDNVTGDVPTAYDVPDGAIP